MKHSVQELNDIAKEARRVTMKCHGRRNFALTTSE